jgi:putative membrane protein insertion efficiency factor
VTAADLAARGGWEAVSGPRVVEHGARRLEAPRPGTDRQGSSPPEAEASGAGAGRDGTARPRSSCSLAQRLLIGMVRCYQIARQGRPSPCRFVPSCSTYAVEAIESHGSRRGVWLAVRRVLRCHPWGGFGADPVPE